MAVLERDHDLLEDPTGAHALLLRLISQMSEGVNPVGREALEWEVDHGQYTHPDVAGVGTALRVALGPRPRRENLYRAVRALVSHGDLEQGPKGFLPSAYGAIIVEKLEADAG